MLVPVPVGNANVICISLIGSLMSAETSGISEIRAGAEKPSLVSSV